LTFSEGSPLRAAYIAISSALRFCTMAIVTG
jgi:hypothetical protein